MASIVTTSSQKKSPTVVAPFLILSLALIVAVILVAAMKTGGSQTPQGKGAPSQLLGTSHGVAPDDASSTSADPTQTQGIPSQAGAATSKGDGHAKPSSRTDEQSAGGESCTLARPSAKQVAPQPVEAPAQKKIFENDVENNLMEISRIGFDCLEPPRVNLSHEQTLEILRRPIQIEEDDDERTVAAKERTAEMKTAALKYIEDGGTLNQFLRDYAAQAKEAAATVKDVREEMLRIFHDEGQEAAQKYLDEVNPQLKEMGLQEVTIGKGTIRIIERRWARETADAQAL